MQLDGAKDVAFEVKDATLAIFIQFNTEQQAREAFIKLHAQGSITGSIDLRLAVGAQIQEH